MSLITAKAPDCVVYLLQFTSVGWFHVNSTVLDCRFPRCSCSPFVSRRLRYIKRSSLACRVSLECRTPIKVGVSNGASIVVFKVPTRPPSLVRPIVLAAIHLACGIVSNVLDCRSFNKLGHRDGITRHLEIMLTPRLARNMTASGKCVASHHYIGF